MIDKLKNIYFMTELDYMRILRIAFSIHMNNSENQDFKYILFCVIQPLIDTQNGFSSLRNRLEIYLGKDIEKAIVQCLNTNNITTALMLYENGLKNIGIDCINLLGDSI